MKKRWLAILLIVNILAGGLYSCKDDGSQDGLGKLEEKKEVIISNLYSLKEETTELQKLYDSLDLSDKESLRNVTAKIYKQCQEDYSLAFELLKDAGEELPSDLQNEIPDFQQ